MKLFVRIICLPSAWPELSRRAAEFQRALDGYAPGMAQPVIYWKDERFYLFEHSFRASCELLDVDAHCLQLFGSAGYRVLTKNGREIEIASFATIPEMLADSNRAFVDLYGSSA